MLKKKEQVADAACAPILDERALDRQRFGVRHKAQPTNLESSHVSRIPDVRWPAL